MCVCIGAELICACVPMCIRMHACVLVTIFKSYTC